MRELNYAIVNPRAPITLDLFEAERYEPAIVVQSLVGNLVYFSNLGRYEPRLAKSWQRISPTTWEFTLVAGIKAENGEEITPASFKASIERSLKKLSGEYPVPILSDLKGFRSFIKGGPLSGLRGEGEKLIFEFESPVRDGLLQIISFAPFGYIATANPTLTVLGNPLTNLFHRAHTGSL